MKKLVLLTLLVSLPAFAVLDDLAIGGGISHSTPELEGGSMTGNVDEDSEISFNGGLLGFYRTQKGRKLRTGLMLVSKKGEVSNTDVEYLYFQVPLTIMRNYSKKMNFFYGLNFGLNLSDDCKPQSGSCDLENVSTIIHPFTVGLRYELSNKVFFEGSYEYSLKENSESINMNSLFLNIFFKL